MSTTKNGSASCPAQLDNWLNHFLLVVHWYRHQNVAVSYQAYYSLLESCACYDLHLSIDDAEILVLHIVFVPLLWLYCHQG